MSKERELLERAYYVLGELSYAMLKDSGEYNLAGDIYEFLSTPEPTQDEEPVAYIQRDQLEKAVRSPMLCVVSPESRQDRVGIFLHPAPRPEFVRLSEEEVNSLTYAPLEPYELICAVENRLVEKNK